MVGTARSRAFAPPYEMLSAIGVETASPMCHHVCGGSHMATNLSIDPELIERALELSGERTKKAAVTKALQEFIARRRQKRLLELVGKLEWDESYDYKAERGRK
jgi:Arc/MetJ family transcription regulator